MESLDTENSEPNFEASSADIQFTTGQTDYTDDSENTDSAEVVFTEDNNRQSKEDEKSRRTKAKEENAKEGAPESQTETQNRKRDFHFSFLLWNRKFFFTQSISYKQWEKTVIRISVRTRIIEETVQGEKSEIILSEKYELDSRTYEEEQEEREDKMIVAIAAGIGGFFILMILLVTACCISRRVRKIFFEILVNFVPCDIWSRVKAGKKWARNWPWLV